MCVHAATMRQTKHGERLIVHLYNDLNTTAHHALPVDDVPLREEVVPIHDIRVRFSAKYPIKEVRLQSGGIQLPVSREGDEILVTVPKLEVHAMVVAELSKTDE